MDQSGNVSRKKNGRLTLIFTRRGWIKNRSGRGDQPKTLGSNVSDKKDLCIPSECCPSCKHTSTHPYITLQTASAQHYFHIRSKLFTSVYDG